MSGTNDPAEHIQRIVRTGAALELFRHYAEQQDHVDVNFTVVTRTTTCLHVACITLDPNTVRYILRHNLVPVNAVRLFMNDIGVPATALDMLHAYYVDPHRNAAAKHCIRLLVDYGGACLFGNPNAYVHLVNYTISYKYKHNLCWAAVCMLLSRYKCKSPLPRDMRMYLARVIWNVRLK